MRVVIQRVKHASVEVGGETESEIGAGLLVFLGVEEADDGQDVDWLCQKIAGLRIFNDDEEKMNYSVEDVGGDVLVVSQFTLHASTKKGMRPSFVRAAKPDQAVPLYEQFVTKLKLIIRGEVKTGVFGEDMQVSLLNDGPVTITIDTKNRE